MPNFTITIPDSLKTEMENLSEVNWSEVCRNAISQYIAHRKNPTPKIELSLDRTSLEHEHLQTGYPTLTIRLKIHNNMDSEIMVDRIIVNIKLFENSRTIPIGYAYDLNKKTINSHSTTHAPIYLALPKEKIEDLASTFTSTFHSEIRCVVYVEGFRNYYQQDLTTRIPIDDWKRVVKEALKKHQTTRVDR